MSSSRSFSEFLFLEINDSIKDLSQNQYLSEVKPLFSSLLILTPNQIILKLLTCRLSNFYSTLLINNPKISCAAFEIFVPGPKTPKTPALYKKS